MSSTNHFLDIDALDAKTLRGMLDDAHDMKARWKAKDRPKPCTDMVLVTIFEKPSTRTRVSFDLAMRQLGGETINLSPGDMQLGRGESIADTAQVLSRYVDAIMIRTVDHQKMLDLAHHGSVPVINGLTDRTHPSQLMADVMTVEEHLGPIRDKV
ncbi:MAG: ornithine carbamoyltransferase, partial [Rhodospirillaceae bacterium]|nr:ornithine carbamoyltransferase [Rhodospirillaceae bacterium]